MRSVILGEVVVGGSTTKSQLEKIRTVLEENGFELTEDRNVQIIEKIKHASIRLAQNDYEKNPLEIRDSEFISKEVGQEYHSLSTLFSSVESITIEHYLILQRIEHAKELMKYGELNLSEIAYKMGYSSLAHLSNQFKKTTGMSPSKFNSLGGSHRHSIDQVGRH
ncbi:MAG: AraC family transcriptional regulator [Bacteroidota bacterium]